MTDSPAPSVYAISTAGIQQLQLASTGCGVHELFDHLALGVYEGFRTFHHNRFLHFDRHLARAQRAFERMEWPAPLDEASLRRGIQLAAEKWPGEDARIRLDFCAQPATELGTDSRVLIALEELTPVPPSVLEQGARLAVAHGKQRHDPHVKHAQWVIDRRGTGPGDGGYYEYVLLDDHERILECSSSNFFAVRDGALWTAGAEVLEGVMRSIVLDLAHDRDLTVHFDAPRLTEIDQFDEAFLTSSSRGMVPIAEVAGLEVRDPSRPGPIVTQLRADFSDLIERAAVPAWPPDKD